MKPYQTDTRFFRAGVATVIYTKDRKVAFFERAQNPIGVWEFQQGGIDLGEDHTTTLWRELKEEIGLEKKDIDKVTEMPDWHVTLSKSSLENKSNPRLGQVHKWYFLKLKHGIKIDLTKATKEEATGYKLVDFNTAINMTNDYRRDVYRLLQQFFDSKIT